MCSADLPTQVQTVLCRQTGLQLHRALPSRWRTAKASGRPRVLTPAVPRSPAGLAGPAAPAGGPESWARPSPCAAKTWLTAGGWMNRQGHVRGAGSGELTSSAGVQRAGTPFHRQVKRALPHGKRFLAAAAQRGGQQQSCGHLRAATASGRRRKKSTASSRSFSTRKLACG